MTTADEALHNTLLRVADLAVRAREAEAKVARVEALLAEPRFLDESIIDVADLRAALDGQRRVNYCTCTGPIPGYPQHEQHCGWEQVE